MDILHILAVQCKGHALTGSQIQLVVGAEIGVVCDGGVLAVGGIGEDAAVLAAGAVVGQIGDAVDEDDAVDRAVAQAVEGARVDQDVAQLGIAGPALAVGNIGVLDVLSYTYPPLCCLHNAPCRGVSGFFSFATVSAGIIYKLCATGFSCRRKSSSPAPKSRAAQIVGKVCLWSRLPWRGALGFSAR